MNVMSGRDEWQGVRLGECGRVVHTLNDSRWLNVALVLFSSPKMLDNPQMDYLTRLRQSRRPTFRQHVSLLLGSSIVLHEAAFQGVSEARAPVMVADGQIESEYSNTL